MAATNGTMIFRGITSKRTYIKDVYLSDTDGGSINMDGGSGASATSPQDWSPPEPVVLVDFSVVTGAAQTKIQVTRDGVPTGDMLRQTIHLTTLANRPALAIVFGARQSISGIQRA